MHVCKAHGCSTCGSFSILMRVSVFVVAKGYPGKQAVKRLIALNKEDVGVYFAGVIACPVSDRVDRTLVRAVVVIQQPHIFTPVEGSVAQQVIQHGRSLVPGRVEQGCRAIGFSRVGIRLRINVLQAILTRKIAVRHAVRRGARYGKFS